MCGEKRRRKYWFFGVWMDLPYFIVAVIGVIMFILGIILFILFTPPVVDIISLLISFTGIVLSTISTLSNVTKDYFDTAVTRLEERLNALEQEIRRGFTALETLLKEIRDELRKR